MTVVATRRRSRRTRTGAGSSHARPTSEGAPEPTLFDDRPASRSGEPTLADLVSGLWDGLVDHRCVPCPVCGGEMAPGYGAHAQTVVGRCGECDTTLA